MKIEAKITLDAAPCFADLLNKAIRFLGFKGGRGGAKSESVAEYIVFLMGTERVKVLCTREIQRSIKESVKSLIERKIQEKGLADEFDIVETEIRHKNTGATCLFAGLQNHTANSIKSYDDIDFCWVEEAQTIKAKSLGILVPTIRKPGSRIVFTWNPDDEMDAIEVFWKTPRGNGKLHHINYYENKYCTKELKDEAEHCKISTPEEYEHIWLGGYVGVQKGAYWAKQISAAIEEGRISFIPHEPTLEVHLALDLGMSDLTTIWFYQVVGREIHIIDYYQSTYTSASDDAVILNRKPYKYGKMWLPHDAKQHQKGTGKTQQEVYESLGFRTEIAPNIPVMDGINAVRDLFPRLFFDSKACHEGLKAIKSYCENIDDKLGIGKGPRHDKNSHASDALRYLAVSIGSHSLADRAEKLLSVPAQTNLSKDDIRLTQVIAERFQMSTPNIGMNNF